MGMLVEKKHVGFGLRSWRYSAIINDGVVEKWWQEDGMNNDGSDPDPYEQTTPENCIEYLSKNK
jgi:peroxiredoxin